jgi:DNA-binding MarR family transcriptional regulator/predicted  nucleic acid-binding Zn-ribbon protein
MYCPKCGTKVREGDKFCYKCGNRLEFWDSVEDQKPSKVKRDHVRDYDENIKVRVNCTIQGMDRNFKPNGSYDTIDLGEVSLNQALDVVRRLPDKDDFPPRLLMELKEGYDVCPAAVILSYGEYMLNISSLGEKGYLEVFVDGFLELAGWNFRQKDPVTLTSYSVSREDAEAIVTDFYRKIDRLKELGLSLSPTEFSVLMAIRHGISNTNAIAKLTGKSIREVKATINDLAINDLIKIRKKGLLRKKRYYEITSKGELALLGDKEKLGRVVRDDDLVDCFAVAFWMMYALHDLPDGVSALDVVDSVGEPPESTIDDIADLESDIAYDDGGDMGDGDGGDWGDGDADGAW